MSTPNNLQPFIEPVPTCIQTTKLAKLLEIFSQNQCDRVVVVNEGHSPLALVSLRRLMPHLIAGFASTAPSPDRGVGESGSQFRTPLDLDRPIGSLQNSGSQALTTPLLEPLATLSAHLSLSQFWPYLQDQRELPDEGLEWAFVDAGGRFLGMLDRRRLLQFLAAHSLVDRATSFRLGADTAQQPEETPETLDRLSGNSEHPSKLAQHSLLKTLHPLIKLLKKLPLPLRLQTNTGKVISRNLAWRRQFPVIPDDGIENPNETTETPKTSPSQTMNVLADPSLAEIGEWRSIDSEPATSPVAFCPIPTGHEKVWQFINIPLGIVLPPQKAIAQPDSEPQVTSPSVLNRRETPNPGAHQTLSPAISSKRAKDKNEMGLAAGESDADTSLPFGKANPSQDSAATRPEAGLNGEWELGKVGAPGGDKGHGDWGMGIGAKKSPIPDPQSSVLDASLANLNSEETLCLLLAQDVTDQHQVAKELAAKNADLVQLNRLKDEFLACISHELKTPLTAVLGLSSLLKDRAIGPLNERQARYARLIYQSGRHLMTVVNDILDLTRIETGQLELILEPVNVLATCDRAYKQAQQNHTSSESPQTNASLGDDAADDAENETPFAVEIEADVQTLVADEMRLRQMLVNLLSNALKFTEPGGAIGLKVSRWEGWIAFTVWDTGIGIPDHKQHLIFQKFQQLENPLTRRFEGAGLGLVLTQRLARLHGGDVTFISSEGKGSQFTLLLPPCPPQPSTLLGETATHRHRLVLIVEAVPRFIEALSEQLIELGYRVVIARTGTEALEKARRFSPEVVFINPVLPLLSGWDVLTLLKSDEATDRIPAIVTATQAEKELAFQNRADGFLSLPVQASALRQKLAHIHERSRDSATKITVLRLNTIAKAHDDGSDDLADIGSMPEIAELMADLNSLLHRHNYRILEADELEQAELLARVWQPNVLLLNSAAGLYDPLAYFRQLSQYSSLASLPLVALEQEIARSANQVPGLTVFSGFWTSGAKSPPTALLHVIQLAAGITWKPNILVVDISTLPDLSVSPVYGSHSSESLVPFSSFQAESLPALIQYIQTAGFKGLIGRSWSEMLQFLEHQSIDLLLICGRPAIPPPALLEALVSLGQRAAKPPILAIAQRSDSVAKSERSRSAQDVSKTLKNVDESLREVEMSDELKAQTFSQNSSLNTSQTLLDRVLQQIAIEILPPDVSMAALLETINRILVKS